MYDNFEGIYPYLVSPVNEDGTVREKVLRDLVNHLIDCGVHGLTPLGSTGEFFYLDWAQKKEIVRIVIDETAGRVPIVAGVACSTIREAQFQAKEFEKMGADGILASSTCISRSSRRTSIIISQRSQRRSAARWCSTTTRSSRDSSWRSKR